MLCQRGAEAALKRELLRSQPEWRAAYQRPGLLTFRAPTPIDESVEIAAVLARSSGLSLGTYADLNALCSALETLPAPLRLHVIERDLYREDEAPKGYQPGEHAARIDAELRARLGERIRSGTTAEPSERVIDVILGEAGSTDPLLLGMHVHDKARPPEPGGTYRYEVPDDAPSRAYRKIEEAIRAFSLPIRAGDHALELGAAPGGATYALLRRGISVVGIDPAEMDPHVLAFTGPENARLTHVRLPMNAVDLNTLPRTIDWLLLDVHLAPQVALRQASRFLSHYKSSLLGAVLTLKLNDWKFLDHVERWKRDLQPLGLVTPIARQLPAHRQELVIASLTTLGRRVSRG